MVWGLEVNKDCWEVPFSFRWRMTVFRKIAAGIFSSLNLSQSFLFQFITADPTQSIPRPRLRSQRSPLWNSSLRWFHCPNFVLCRFGTLWGSWSHQGLPTTWWKDSLASSLYSHGRSRWLYFCQEGEFWLRKLLLSWLQRVKNIFSQHSH